MKSLNPTKPLIIVMVGTPGAGKSFFARQFAETFSAPLISFDYIRYTFFPEPKHDKSEMEVIATFASYEIQQLLKTGRTFIIDGGHDARATRSELEKIAKKAGYQVMLVWVQTDEPTAKRRSLKRNMKRSIDDYVASINEAMFMARAKRFDEPRKSEEFIVISGKHTYSVQARVVLKRIADSKEGGQNVEVPKRSQPDQPRQNRGAIQIQ